MSSSSTARALSIPEILIRVLVRLPDPDLWTVSGVSTEWWQAAQYGAFLTRERRPEEPEWQLDCLVQGLCLGGRALGRGVKHVNLSTEDPLDWNDYDDGTRYLYQSMRSMSRAVFRACPNVTSLALHGSGYAFGDLVKFVPELVDPSRIEWLRLTGLDEFWVDNVPLPLAAAFPNLRHLRLDGFHPADGEALRLLPPGLASLVVSPEYFHKAEYDVPTLEALARASGPGLRHLGLDRLGANSSEPGSGLTRAALARVPELWPGLEELDLFVSKENLASDAGEVLGLLQMHGMRRLRLRVYVGHNQRAGAWRALVRGAVGRLSEGQKGKVVVEIERHGQDDLVAWTGSEPDTESDSSEDDPSDGGRGDQSGWSGGGSDDGRSSDSDSDEASSSEWGTEWGSSSEDDRSG